MSEPAVSVLMPAYNAAAHICEAVDSVLAQTFQNFELLIVNDGSSDDTVALVESYSDDRIRLVNNEQNLGLPATLNKGISMCKAPYIARMDADDICYADRLQKQFDFMEDHPQVGLLGGWAKKFDAEEGDMIHPATSSENLKINLLISCVFIHPSVMFRRSALGKLDVLYRDVVAEDYDLWIRLAEVTEVANIPEFLLQYRVHGGQLTQSKKTENNDESMGIRFSLLENLLGNITEEDKASLLDIVNQDWREDKVAAILLLCSRMLAANESYKKYRQEELLEWVRGIINPVTLNFRSYSKSTQRELCRKFHRLLKLVLPEKKINKIRLRSYFPF